MQDREHEIPAVMIGAGGGQVSTITQANSISADRDPSQPLDTLPACSRCRPSPACSDVPQIAQQPTLHGSNGETATSPAQHVTVPARPYSPSRPPTSAEIDAVIAAAMANAPPAPPPQSNHSDFGDGQPSVQKT